MELRPNQKRAVPKKLTREVLKAEPDLAALARARAAEIRELAKQKAVAQR